MYNVTIEITSTGYQVKNLSYLNHILVKIVSSSFLARDEKELDREVRTKDFEAIYEDRKYIKNPYTWTYRFFKFSNVFYSNVFVVIVNEIKNAGSHLLKKRGLYRAIYPHVARKIGLGSWSEKKIFVRDVAKIASRS